MKKLTPVKSIRAMCLECCNGQMAEVRRCPVETCSLWPYRLGCRPAKSTPALAAETEKQPCASPAQGAESSKRLTPIQAIRSKCRNCSADQLAEVRRCRIKDCPLWQFRMGCRPPKPATTPELAPEPTSTPEPTMESGKIVTLRRVFSQGELF